MEKTEKRIRVFRLHALVSIFALMAEFIIGMYAALFVEFPESLVDGNAWAWSMSKSFVVVAHALLGTLLAAVSIATLAQGIALKTPRAWLPSVAGLLMVGLSWLSGAAFLSNVASDGFSFLMAIGFIGALFSYGLAFYFARPSGETVSA
jgi:hypothetical protein